MLFENCNTVTTVTDIRVNYFRKTNLRKKSCEVFVDRNEIFVPLPCRKMKPRRRAFRRKIARIKSRNCAH